LPIGSLGIGSGIGRPCEGPASEGRRQGPGGAKSPGKQRVSASRQRRSEQRTRWWSKASRARAPTVSLSQRCRTETTRSSGTQSKTRQPAERFTKHAGFALRRGEQRWDPALRCGASASSLALVGRVQETAERLCRLGSGQDGRTTVRASRLQGCEVVFQQSSNWLPKRDGGPASQPTTMRMRSVGPQRTVPHGSHRRGDPDVSGVMAAPSRTPRTGRGERE
jgi:hypothetical protein